MYREHKYFELPEKKETIWRYMDFWKFKDLIESKTLYLSTIKKMGLSTGQKSNFIIYVQEVE